MKMLSIRFDDAEYAALTQLSRQLGETRLQVVKRSIAALARQKLRGESSHEWAEKLIGAFSGQADLSETVATQVRRKLNAEAARRR